VWKLFSTIVEKSGNYKRTVSIAWGIAVNSM
jgi:hypothetical protein